MTKNQIRAKRKLFLAHTVQHVYTDVEIKSMVQKSIGLDKSKVTEYRCVSVKFELIVEYHVHAICAQWIALSVVVLMGVAMVFQSHHIYMHHAMCP